MKLLCYRGLTVSAGISHQLSNLQAMLKEACLCGRRLLLPRFHLAGHHNCGRGLRSTLAEYYEMGSARVAGERVEVVESVAMGGGVIPVVPAGEDLRGRPEPVLCKDVSRLGLVRVALQKVYPGFTALRAEVDIHPALRAVAERAAGWITPQAVWVHVRRGDLRHRTARATAPENIRRVVATVAPEARALYIATNEPAPGFFDPLRAHYEVAGLREFPEFRQLAQEDNYRLFLVEQVFSRFFPVRISTFRTPGDWFHAALCEARGWQ